MIHAKVYVTIFSNAGEKTFSRSLEIEQIPETDTQIHLGHIGASRLDSVGWSVVVGFSLYLAAIEMPFKTLEEIERLALGDGLSEP